MPVPFFDLTRQDAVVGAAVRERVAAVFASQQFILGRAVEDFEESFRALIGCGHAVGMSSGTDAQLAVLMALGIGPGDAVVTPSFTFFATAGCVARLGAEPVFVDIEPATFHLDSTALRRWIEGRCRRASDGTMHTPSGSRLRAIVPVHLFGVACAMDAIMELAAEFGLVVVEDAAQAVGAEFPSSQGARRVGSLAGAAFFSFFPTKNLGAAGDAGMAVCRDEAFAARLRALRNHGMSAAYRHDVLGGNFRLDAIQAAVLSAKLPHLSDWNAARRRHAALYRELLGPLEAEGLVRLPAEPHAQAGSRDHHTYHQFVIRVPRRDALREALAGEGIGTAVYYPLPLHLQPAFARFGGQPGDCPVAERASAEVLALPIFPELEPGEIRVVADAITAFLRAPSSRIPTAARP